VAEDMLDDVFAGEMARSGQIGIAKQIQEQLRQQNSSGGGGLPIDGVGTPPYPRE